MANNNVNKIAKYRKSIPFPQTAFQFQQTDQYYTSKEVYSNILGHAQYNED